MTTWLKRNAIALAVIPVMLALYYFATVAPRFDEYAKTRTPDPDVVVAYGQSTDVRGTRWSVQNVQREIYDSSKGRLPDGFEAFRILFARNPADAPKVRTTCTGTLVDGDIRWEARPTYGVSGPSISVSTGPEGTTPSCQDPGTFQVGFLVPKDTAPDAVDISFSFGQSGDQGAQVVRFLLPD